MLHAANLLQIADECGRDIDALLETLQDEAELFASPNTLSAVERHMQTMAYTLGQFDATLHQHVQEVDWVGWQAVHEALVHQLQPRRELVWYAVRALVPATRALLHRARRRNPGLFLVP